MISRFFIDRPVFSSVLSIVIVLLGLVSISMLPVEQFPEITPPTVNVSATYPGASAEVVAQSLAAPIEQELSGAQNMLYYQTQCSNNGSMNITVTFETGTDVDLAAVEVQNRVARAEPRLPQESTRQGIVVSKRSSAWPSRLSSSWNSRLSRLAASHASAARKRSSSPWASADARRQNSAPSSCAKLDCKTPMIHSRAEASSQTQPARMAGSRPLE